MISLPDRRYLFKMLAMLTTLFVFLQFYFFICYLFKYRLINIIVHHASFKLTEAHLIIFPLLSYLCCQFLLYAFYFGMLWYFTISINQLFKLSFNTTSIFCLFLWAISIAVIISANSLYFHHSLFAIAGQEQPFIHYSLIATLWGGSAFLTIILLLSTANFLISIHKKTYSKVDSLLIASFFILGFLLIDFNNTPHPQADLVATKKRPNVILISIEALRPEYIYQPYHNDITMPFVASILKESIQFTDAYTPIAQSFPSWISLITAKTPLHNGARSLYTRYDKIHFANSFIEKMKESGYETIYAVDGQRFGDLTPQTGYDHIISPPYGAAELIIGSLSDFPLSNLLVSTHLGKYLFPYSYANRSIVTTYRPKDFLNLLRDEIGNHRTKPLFLSVHFGISHWPYQWADDVQSVNASLPDQYKYSLHAADNQIASFFDFLNAEKLLDHAILIFISDHGIGLGMPGDRVIQEGKYIGNLHQLSLLRKIPYSTRQPTKFNAGIDTSYGYSTDILSLKQYHILFAFNANGIDIGKAQKIETRVSIMDIGPTILALLKAPPIPQADGISLVSEMQNTQPSLANKRTLIFENGFTIPEIAKANISVNEILSSSIETVNFDNKSGLFYITDNAEQFLLKNKQRSILFGDWLLARYPQYVALNASNQTLMVLVNLKSGLWTTDLTSSFAQSAPIQLMLNEFHSYYGSELSS